MERLELQTTVRKSTGNSPARSLRRSGHIPAILYGPKTDPVLLSVNVKELEQVFKRGNVYQIILNLVIQNGKKITKAAMVKELQTHPLSRLFLPIWISGIPSISGISPWARTLKFRRMLILRWLPYSPRRSKKRLSKKRKPNSRTVKPKRAERLPKPTNLQRKNRNNGRPESPSHSCDPLQLWRRPSSLLL